jgi:hypothetical protein
VIGAGAEVPCEGAGSVGV